MTVVSEFDPFLQRHVVVLLQKLQYHGACGHENWKEGFSLEHVAGTKIVIESTSKSSVYRPMLPMLF